jgi:hypothetical protein
MTLLTVFLLILLGFSFFLFWQSRGISESAIRHVKHYCEQHQLQLISVSRKSRKLGIVAGRIGWLSTYQFEFSGNQEDKFVGYLLLANKQMKKIDVPAYKIH